MIQLYKKLLLVFNLKLLDISLWDLSDKTRLFAAYTKNNFSQYLWCSTLIRAAYETRNYTVPLLKFRSDSTDRSLLCGSSTRMGRKLHKENKSSWGMPAAGEISWQHFNTLENHQEAENSQRPAICFYSLWSSKLDYVHYHASFPHTIFSLWAISTSNLNKPKTLLTFFIWKNYSVQSIMFLTVFA